MQMTTGTSRNEEIIPFHVPAENADLKHCYPVGQLSIDVRNDPKVRFSFDHMVITLSNTHICLWNFVSNEKVIWTADNLNDRDQIKVCVQKLFLCSCILNALTQGHQSHK